MFKHIQIGNSIPKALVVKTIEEKKREEITRSFYAMGRNPNSVSPAERRRITTKFEGLQRQNRKISAGAARGLKQ